MPLLRVNAVYVCSARDKGGADFLYLNLLWL